MTESTDVSIIGPDIAENGAVALLTVTPEGGKPMAGTAWAAGRRLKAGDSL